MRQPCNVSLLSLGVALAVAACGGRAGTPRSQAQTAVDPSADLRPSDTAKDVEARSEDQLVALELAVNQLRPIVHQCWAAAAADDYQLRGELTLRLQWPIGKPGFPFSKVPEVDIGADTTKDKTLSACVMAVVRAYPWTATMRGAAFDLPFAFAAPSGQYAVDRRFVGSKQGAVMGIATLLDAKNSGQRAATMVEVTLDAKGDTGWGMADRHEAWVALTPGQFVVGGHKRSLGAGDVVLLAPGEFRRFVADKAASFAVVLAPGGIEGTLRAGAMPSRTFASAPKKETPIRHVRVGDPDHAPFDIAVLRLPAGKKIESHVNAPGVTELLYLQQGTGQLTVGKVTQDIGPFHVVQIPAGVSHAFVATSEVQALQWLVTGGVAK
ncbi:MAG: cupin domain-containing protein [Myxococcales bacterium]|nr:cupin domain-containing protein [Myxococcales bacterium]